MIKRGIKIASIIFLVLIVIEVFFRLFLHEQLKTRSYPLVFRPDSLVGYTLIPNKTARICIPSIEKEFTLNSQGFYGPDFTEKKPSKKIRVMFVGNSYTEGISLNAVESYPMILQKIFDKNNMSHVEVINCSIGGQDMTLKMCKMVEYYLLKYEPDYIMLNISFPLMNNNMARDNYRDYVISYASGSERSRTEAMRSVDRLYDNYKFLSFLYNSSYIVRGLAKKYSENYSGPLSTDIGAYIKKMNSCPDLISYKLSYQSSITYLKDLMKIAEEKKCKIVPFQFENDQLFKRLTFENGITSISLNIKFDESCRHEHDGHINEKGHQLVAERLFAEMIKSKLIPQQL